MSSQPRCRYCWELTGGCTHQESWLLARRQPTSLRSWCWSVVPLSTLRPLSGSCSGRHFQAVRRSAGSRPWSCSSGDALLHPASGRPEFSDARDAMRYAIPRLKPQFQRSGNAHGGSLWSPARHAFPPPRTRSPPHAASHTRSNQPAASTSHTPEGLLGRVLDGHRHRSLRLRAETDDHPQRSTRRAGLRR